MPVEFTCPDKASWPDVMHFSATGDKVDKPATAGVVVQVGTGTRSGTPHDTTAVVCGECTVLVQDGTTAWRLGNSKSRYGSCNAYCLAVGRVCTGAWDANYANGCQKRVTDTVVTCATPFSELEGYENVKTGLCDCGEPVPAHKAAVAQLDLAHYYAGVLGARTPNVDGIVLNATHSPK